MCTRHQPLDYYIQLIAQVKTKYPHLYICVMTYANPVYQYGYTRFMDALVDAGCDCFLIPDMPLSEYHHLPVRPS
jgi:tryptophan synthase alpha subunit